MNECKPLLATPFSLTMLRRTAEKLPQFRVRLLITIYVLWSCVHVGRLIAGQTNVDTTTSTVNLIGRTRMRRVFLCTDTL